MKAERFSTAACGALLSFGISFGAVSSLRTGFRLTVVEPGMLWLVCGLAAVIGSICFLWKWGVPAVLCLAALWAGYLWHNGEAGLQILQLIYRISYGYDQAYNWGVLQLVDTHWKAGLADYPLQILGTVIALSISHTLCRGRRTWPAMLLALIPLMLCLVVTDTVPSEGSLFLLLLGLVLLLLTASVRRLDREQAVRLVWLLLIPVTAAMLLLFHLAPKDDYVNQSEEVRQSILDWVESLPEKVEDTTREIASAVSGSGDETVDLKTLGRRSSLAYPVMEITSDWGGNVYLRERDYDSYSGTGWTATPHRAEEFLCTGEDAGLVTIKTRTRQEIRFLPYYPGDGVTLAGGSAENEEGIREYSISRTVLPDNWRSLVQERSQGHWESEVEFTAALEASKYLDSARYLLLPTDTLQRAKTLLQSILDEEETATAKADAIAAYVRGSARYDRNTDRMPSDAEDFALWFLEESDIGYCVHFATASVVLLRAAGIPSRYVTGYLVPCGPGETVTVTADTAHAWAEYFEPQLGCWIPLEATPAEGLSAGMAPTRDEDSSETRGTQPETSVPTQTPEPEQGKPGPQPGQTSAPAQQEKHPVLSLKWLWLPVLLALPVVQRPVRISLRRRKLRGSPNDRALGYWQEICLLYALRKEPVPRQLEKLALKAKFSQHILSSDELAEMESYIFDSVEELRQRPWYQRLLHRYFYAAY